MFTFTPLQGARSESRASQSLLELDGGIKILVDVGWDVTFDPHLLADIEKQTQTLSFILLTHATISHLGAFIHCQKFIPNFSQIPVYATLPVITFGATLLKEIYRTRPVEADETTKNLQNEANPTPEEIDRYFSLINPLKYSQPHQPKASFFSAPLDDLTITAYNSGHTLGGAIWHVQHEMESIIYAVDWNIVRENVIPAAAWFGGVGGSEVIEALRNPTALVCSSRGGTQVAAVSGGKARDDLVLDHIKSCVAKGRSVVIPAVPLARLLELAWMLEKACQSAAEDSPLRQAKFYLASMSALTMLRNARSLLDWMNESISKEYEEDAGDGNRVFDFKHVKLIKTRKKFDKVLASEDPKVIITGDVTAEWPGFSHAALTSLCKASENLMILTDDYASDSVMTALVQCYQERLHGVAIERSAGGETQLEQVYGGGRELALPQTIRTPLAAADFQTLQSLVSRRHMESSMAGGVDAAVPGTEDAIEDDASSSSSDESDDEQQGRALNVSSVIGKQKNKLALNDEELGVSVLLRKRGVHDYDVRNRKGRNSVFPYTHSRRRGDEYGDYIRPEDFLRAEEREAANSTVNSTDQTSSKRKWDVAVQSDDSKNKRQRSGQSRRDSTPVRPANDPYESSESEDSESESEIPRSTESSLTLNARLALVDFRGIHDQRSLQMLIPLIGSKRVILIEGEDEETSALAADCKQLLTLKDEAAQEDNSTVVFAPVNGETVDASVDTDTWDLKLGKALFRKLNWAPVQGRNVATLTGEIRAEPSQVESDLQERTKKLKLMKSDSDIEMKSAEHHITPVLDVLSLGAARSALSMERPIHVGDVILKELQRFMVDEGHRARFAGGGTLLVDDMVAVRKLGTGKIVVEGAPVTTFSGMAGNTRADSFTQVKRKIYEGLPVVAAS